jgi:hypothetical protein
MIRIVAALTVILILSLAPRVSGSPLDIAAIEKAAGVKGAWFADEKVYKLTFPRKDLNARIGDLALPPSLLTSWASFKGGNESPAIMMGQVFLSGDELNTAIAAALDAELDVTALNNPFASDEPRVYSLHIAGEGTADKLAAGVRNVMQAIQHSRGNSQSTPKTAPTSGTLSAPALDAIFGARGEITDHVYRIAFGREVAMPCACKAGKEMGVQSFATFFGGDDRATVSGQIACVFGELQPVLKMLRKNGVDITAISNHLDGEAPRMIFVHYASTGRASDLAKSIKAAIDELGKRPDMHQHHH